MCASRNNFCKFLSLSLGLGSSQCTALYVSMGLSARVLKPDSLIRIPDPDSMWCCVSSTRHVDYAHCTAGLELTSTLLRALSRRTARSSDPDRCRVEAKWSLNPDPRSASDSDPKSRVESPYILLILSGCSKELSLIK